MIGRRAAHGGEDLSIERLPRRAGSWRRFVGQAQGRGDVEQGAERTGRGERIAGGDRHLRQGRASWQKHSTSAVLPMPASPLRKTSRPSPAAASRRYPRSASTNALRSRSAMLLLNPVGAPGAGAAHGV